MGCYTIKPNQSLNQPSLVVHTLHASMFQCLLTTNKKNPTYADMTSSYELLG